MKFIVIAPLKDEGKTLEKLLDSIKAFSGLTLWIIFFRVVIIIELTIAVPAIMIPFFLEE